ncbi:MAG: DNA-binding protein [Candidatus Hydrogenedentes bacterium]|nr:DNA-binding protein [Candidatus Hydrogenedentota bacterium]
METLTINLSGGRLDQLKRMAEQLNIAPADLAQAGIDDLLAHHDEAFTDAMERVLRKNAELYRRLA